MNVLFITHDYPFPVTYGGQVYTGNVIKEWGALCERMDVICFRSGQNVPESRSDGSIHWEILPAPASSAHRKLFSRWPGITAIHVDQRVLVIAKRLLAERTYSYVVIDYIAIGWIIAPLRRILRTMGHKAPKLVYMSHNVETVLRKKIAGSIKGGAAIQLAARFDAWRAERLERRLVAECDITSVETNEDAAEMMSLLGAQSVIKLAPGYSGQAIEERHIDSETPIRVAVLGGRLSSMKQIVLSSLLDKTAEAIVDAGIGLHIIGPATDSYLMSCREAYPRVNFHGFVAEVGPLLSQMRAGIVADHVGGGFKHRILTYVFYRVPIIALPEAMAGLPLSAGEDFIAVANYDEIPGAMRAHIENVEMLDAMQNSAFAKCENAFSWSRNLSEFHDRLSSLERQG